MYNYALSTPPALPASALASQCYYQMFMGCSSLTSAPVLPATDLCVYCYRYMFNNCSSLNSISVAFTDWATSRQSTQNWLNGVSANGDFYCPVELSDGRGVDYIPTDWTKHNLYDAEVEYLDGDGTAYISLGLVGQPVKVSTRFAPLATTGDKWMFGGYMFTDTTLTSRIGIYTGAGSKFTWNNYTITYVGVDYSTTTDYIDAEMAYEATPKLAFTLFAQRWGGNPTGMIKARCWGAKVTSGGKLIMDLIPVRIGTVGYLFDKINLQLYGNANTSGAFVCGPDK